MKDDSREDGTRHAPFRCEEYSEACDAAVECDRPIYCLVFEDSPEGTLIKVFPSRIYDEVPS